MHKNPGRGMRLPSPPSAARKVAMGARNHFSGVLVFGDQEEHSLELESHTEMQIALVLLARPDVIDLKNQVPFRWCDHNGVFHTHYFDFLVTL